MPSATPTIASTKRSSTSAVAPAAANEPAACSRSSSSSRYVVPDHRRLGHHQRALDERAEHVEDGGPVGAGDSGREAEVERAGEHAEQVEHAALVLVEQPGGDLDRRPHRVVAVPSPIAAPQQVEALVHGAQQLAGSRSPGPGLRPARSPAAARRGGRTARSTSTEVVRRLGAGGRGPLDEQLDRWPRGQRAEHVHVLAGDADRRPAARDHGDVGRRLPHGADHGAHRVEHVLAAVEHDDASLFGEPDRGRVDGLEPERVGDGGRVGAGRQGGQAPRGDRAGDAHDDVSDEA